MRRKGGAPTHGSLRSPPACGVGDESRESGMQSSFSAWLALDIFSTSFPSFSPHFFFFWFSVPGSLICKVALFSETVSMLPVWATLLL